MDAINVQIANHVPWPSIVKNLASTYWTNFSKHVMSVIKIVMNVKNVPTALTTLKVLYFMKNITNNLRLSSIRMEKSVLNLKEETFYKIISLINLILVRYKNKKSIFYKLKVVKSVKTRTASVVFLARLV